MRVEAEAILSVEALMSARDPLDKARLVIAYTAILVWVASWALNAVAQLGHLDYDIPGSVPTIAVGVAVFFFGAKGFMDIFRRNGKNGNGNGNGETTK